MQANKERIQKHIETLSEYTATPGDGVTRLSYSEEDLQARNYIKKIMKSYDLQVREDGLGNIFGKLPGSLQDAPCVLIGSHFDSVPNGGAYDGAAGVVAGLEVAALYKENNITPKYPLEIIAMVEEEGTRFGGGLMGSRGIVGSIGEAEFKNIKDQDGITVEDAMKKIGLNPSLPIQRAPESIKAFLELHIEQGPILEEKNIPIGVVASIVGLTQLEVTIEGKAGHAGTTPMNRRSDALVAAAKIIAELPGLATNEEAGTVITVGRHQVLPNGANVIPEKVVFTIDIRSGKEESVLSVIQEAKTLISSFCEGDMRTTVEQQLFIRPKALNKGIRSLLAKTSDKLEIPHCSINSGAGHDAMILSDVTDVGMIFVPSKDGLSHCPEEFSAAADLASGANILFAAARKLTEE